MAVRAALDEVGYWVEATPFRAQLHHLMGGTALTAAEVAAVAGISARLAAHLAYGRNGRALRRVSRDTGQRLMALSVAQLRRLRWATEPAGQARDQLERLRQGGWDDPALAERVGSTPDELAELTAGATTCRRLLAVRLAAAADAQTGEDGARAPWRTDEDGHAA